MLTQAHAVMRCWNCPRYNRTGLVCLDGKTNPKKKADAIAVAEVLGLRALCHYSPFRDSFALQMHVPTTAMAIATVARRRKRQSGRGAIEVEIEVGIEYDIEAEPEVTETI